MQKCHTYFFCWQLKNVVNRAESIIGICTVDDVPDARTIWKYRQELTRFCTINAPAPLFLPWMGVIGGVHPSFLRCILEHSHQGF